MNRAAALEALMVTAGRIAFVGFWFIAVLLVYRGLGTGQEGLAQAGLFAIAMATVKVAAGFVSDPIDLAVMRRVPPLLQADAERAFQILRAASVLRLGAVSMIAGVLLIFAPLIATALGDPQAASLVRYVAAAILGDAAYRTVLVVLQASERFGSFILLEGIVQIGRFIVILVLWSADWVQVDVVLASYAAVSFGAALISPWLLPAGLFGSLRSHWHDVADIFHYLKWMVPAMMLAALNERLDVFLIYSIIGPDSAGLYGAALTLALIPDLIGGCLMTLLLPRIARLHASGSFPEAFRRFVLVSVPLCGVVLTASLILAEPVFSLVLGTKYVAAVPAFQWLLAGTLFWLAITPLPMSLLGVLAPRRVVLVTIAQSSIVLFAGILLLSSIGWVGMAQAVFAMRVLVALLLVASARGLATSAPINGRELSGSVQP